MKQLRHERIKLSFSPTFTHLKYHFHQLSPTLGENGIFTNMVGEEANFTHPRVLRHLAAHI